MFSPDLAAVWQQAQRVGIPKERIILSNVKLSLTERELKLGYLRCFKIVYLCMITYFRS